MAAREAGSSKRGHEWSHSRKPKEHVCFTFRGCNGGGRHGDGDGCNADHPLSHGFKAMAVVEDDAEFSSDDDIEDLPKATVVNGWHHYDSEETRRD